jgi:hypothetical protein
MATNSVKTRQLVLRGLAVLALVLVGVLPSALAADIEVTSADPDAAEQATVNLDVNITGNGFGKGAKAKFLVTGTENSGGINVNRTTFVNSKKLIANIDVAEAAETGGFDIEVTTKGRTGKGIDLFSVQKKGDTVPPRAVFRDDPSDGVRSDEQGTSLLPLACQPWDYVDSDDPCYGVETPLVTVSMVHSDGLYFLRTVTNFDPRTVDRWLVLDFSNPENGYECPYPGLDTQILDDPNTDPDPDLLSSLPENTLPCIDYVEVRFAVHEAFKPNVSQTTVSMLIDQPVRKSGHGKNAEEYTQWDAKFALDFINPLTLTRDASSDTVTVGDVSDDDGDDFRAELWTFDNKGRRGDLLGIFIMEFQLTITLVQ